MVGPEQPPLIPRIPARMPAADLEVIGHALRYDGTYTGSAKTRGVVQALYSHALWASDLVEALEAALTDNNNERPGT